MMACGLHMVMMQERLTEFWAADIHPILKQKLQNLNCTASIVGWEGPGVG